MSTPDTSSLFLLSHFLCPWSIGSLLTHFCFSITSACVWHQVHPSRSSDPWTSGPGISWWPAYTPSLGSSFYRIHSQFSVFSSKRNCAFFLGHAPLISWWITHYYQHMIFINCVLKCTYRGNIHIIYLYPYQVTPQEYILTFACPHRNILLYRSSGERAAIGLLFGSLPSWAAWSG